MGRLAVRFTDHRGSNSSLSSLHRIVKAHAIAAFVAFTVFTVVTVTVLSTFPSSSPVSLFFAVFAMSACDCCCGSSGFDPGAMLVSMFVFFVLLASVSALVFVVLAASVCLCLGGSPFLFSLSRLDAQSCRRHPRCHVVDFVILCSVPLSSPLYSPAAVTNPIRSAPCQVLFLVPAFPRPRLSYLRLRIRMVLLRLRLRPQLRMSSSLMSSASSAPAVRESSTPVAYRILGPRFPDAIAWPARCAANL
jgi:hypothetical protein